MNTDTSNISKLFKNYRKGRGLTQSQLAEVLGIAQATVSLIESGNYQPSDEVLDRVLSLYERWSNSFPVRKNIPPPPIGGFTRLSKAGVKDSPRSLSTYFLSATKGRQGSGDVFDTHKISSDEIILFLADAVGHGDDAFLEAQLLKASFISIMVAQPRNASPLDILMSVRKSLQLYNSAYWSKNSILVAYVNTNLNILEVSSFGIPAPIVIAKGRSASDSFQGNLAKNGEGISRAIYRIAQGDCVAFLTDGLIDSGEDRREFEQRLIMYNDLFPGDSKNILEKSISINTDNIKDDVTVVVISKK